MANYKLVEDQKNGNLTFGDPWIFWVGALGVPAPLVTILLVAPLALVTILFVGPLPPVITVPFWAMWNFVPLILKQILILCSIIWFLVFWPSLDGVTITLDPKNRTLTKQLRPLFLLPAPTKLPFSEIENIEVEFYRTGGKGSHDAWRVNALYGASHKIELDLGGEREEMLDLGRKVVTLTGAPLLDHSEQPKGSPSLLDKVLGAGLPDDPAESQLDKVLARYSDDAPTGSQEAVPAPEPDAESAPQTESPDVNSLSIGKAQEPIPTEIPAPGTATAEIEPTSEQADLHNRSQAELENHVAGDPNDAAAHYSLALKYQASGQLDRALELFRQTAVLDPANAEAQDELGVTLEQNGQKTDPEGSYRRTIALLPPLLIGSRFILGPLLYLDVAQGQAISWFVLGFVLACGGDLFDGVIARRTHTVSSALREWDGRADVWFYAWVALCIWTTHPEILLAFRGTLLFVLGLQVLGWILDLIKFRRFSNYHAYSAKAFGLSLFLLVLSLFVFNTVRVTMWLAILTGTFCMLEEMATTIILPCWTHDVWSVRAALRLRAEMLAAESPANKRVPEVLGSARDFCHGVRCTAISPDGVRIEYYLFHSHARTQLILDDSQLDEQGARAFATYVSGYGIAQVLVPARQARDSSSSSTAAAGELYCTDVVRAIVAHARESCPNDPVMVRTRSWHGAVTYQFLGSHYGRDGELPPLEFFKARDGARLAFRHYPSSTSRTLILIHGGSSHSGIYGTLAHYLSARGVAQVYTPNLRGHAHSGSRFGDVAYVGQLEDDLVDLIHEIRACTSKSQIILAGHSFGAGLVIRFAGGRHLETVDGYVALAPYLGHFAPINPRPGASGWARIRLLRFAIAAAAYKLGVPHWDGRPVIDFAPPRAVRDGEETFAYSFRLLASISPRLNYRRDLSAITQPLLVVAGEADELFRVEKYAQEIGRTKRGRVQLIPGATHLGVVFDPRVHHLIGDWLEEFAKE